MGSYKLGVEWPPRRESAAECAERLSAFLRGIADCDASFAEWYEMGDSLEDSLRRRVDVSSPDRMLDLLLRRKLRRETDDASMERMGFIVGVWNGKESVGGCNLTGNCGAYSQPGGNFATMRISQEIVRSLDVAIAARMLAIAARAWVPDSGEFASADAIVDRLRKHRGKPEPCVDWMVYLGRHVKRITTVPSPSTLIPVDDMGVVIVVQPHPPSRENPKDMKHVRAIEEIVKYD